MNRTVLNGALLGSGGGSNRAFVAILTHARAVVAAQAMVWQVCAGAVTSCAKTVLSPSVIWHIAGSISARCTSVARPLLANIQMVWMSLSCGPVTSVRANVRHAASVVGAARALAVATTKKVSGTFVSSSFRATAVLTQNIQILRRLPFNALLARVISSASPGIKAYIVSSTVARAILSNKSLQEDSADSPERLMQLPPENRSMEVPE